MQLEIVFVTLFAVATAVAARPVHGRAGRRRAHPRVDARLFRREAGEHAEAATVPQPPGTGRGWVLRFAT